MISVTEARKLISENCFAAKSEIISLADANGSILAETVFADIDTPPFDQSAMDGYAFSFDSRNEINEFKITGEVQAGDYSNTTLNQNEAVRIFTGAAVPSGADTVVMQEKVLVNDDSIIIQDDQIKKGSNVRLKGSQTKKGEVALYEGQLLTPAGIAFLSGMGICKVKVYLKPTVSIIVTGKELTSAGDEISEGKIYESNSIGLTAALQWINIKPVSVEVAEDDIEKIQTAVSRQLKSDIVILTGGVSVGDYDMVPAALEKCGVEKIFHKVKQKPGKPFYFGKDTQTLIFALPGNPAAVMSCFYEYIVPAISNYTKLNYLKKLQLPLANEFRKKPGLTYFLKGKTVGEYVTILKNQESYLLNSFALADCLIELEEECEDFFAGDLVNVIMIV